METTIKTRLLFFLHPLVFDYAPASCSLHPRRPDAHPHSAAMASDEIGGMCRFYDKEFPDVEESVIVNVKRIAEMGAYVQVRGRRACPRAPPPGP